MDVPIPRSIPHLCQTPPERFSLTNQFFEAVKIDSLVIAPIVQSSLTSKTARCDFDQFTGQISESNSSYTGVQTFAMR
jgi:hypothetical protein